MDMIIASAGMDAIIAGAIRILLLNSKNYNDKILMALPIFFVFEKNYNGKVKCKLFKVLNQMDMADIYVMGSSDSFTNFKFRIYEFF